MNHSIRIVGIMLGLLFFCGGCIGSLFAQQQGESDSLDVHEIGEVQVVTMGMAQQDKRLFTGASTRVEAEQVHLAGVADVSRSLEGRVPGVQVSNVTATFGTAPKIRVRGATSILGASRPLWVIDGVIYEDNVDITADDLSSGDAKMLISSAVAGLSSDDIESLTILKDGSATSIYGARAMAGVIVVTTRRGRKSMPARLQYSAEMTSRMRPSYRQYDIMNSQQTMAIYNEMAQKGWLQIDQMVNAENSGVYGKMYQLLRQYDTTTGQFGLENTEAARYRYLQGAEMRNTDWFGQLFSPSVMHNHSLSVTGGTERSASYVSLSMMDDPGWYLQSRVNRYTFNGNTSFDILPNLTVRLAAQGSHRKQRAPGALDRTTDVVTGEVKRDFDINPFAYALSASRSLDAEEHYTRFYTAFSIFDELRNNYNDIDNNEIMLRGEVQWKPLRSANHTLEVNALVSTRYTGSRIVHNVKDDANQANAYRAGTEEDTDPNSTVREKNRLLYTDPHDPDAQPETVLPRGGIKYQYDYTMRSNNYRTTFQYRGRVAERHIITSLGGIELTTVKNTESRWTGWGYQYDNGGITYTPYLWLKQMNEENTEYFGDSFAKTHALAYFLNPTYSFDRRYTLSATIRYEGTNRLGHSRQSRWLPTWNVAGVWHADEEEWFARLNAPIEAWSVRMSYSLTADAGPRSVSNARAIFQTSNVWRPAGTSPESQITIDDLANRQLTYEKKHELNIGSDLRLFGGRVALAADLYWRDNYDLIGRISTQGSGGQIEKMANVADMKAHGIELSVSGVCLRRKHFEWRADAIWQLMKNRITRFESACRAFDLVSGEGNHYEGYPNAALFSYRFAGLTQEGLPMVINEKRVAAMGDVDLQATQHLTDFLVYEGPTDPTFGGSLNNSFRIFERWGLDLFMTYSGGNVLRLNPVFAASYSDLEAFGREMRNRWMVPGDEATTDVPVVASRLQEERYGHNVLRTAYNAYNYSTARVAHGDFVRLKEVALTYDFDAEVVRRWKMNRLSLRFSATNLCLLYADKRLNGQDPEYTNSGGVASPLPRQFTLTIKAGF